MAWSDIASAVENLAPTIASCIGGPLAGAAVSGLEHVFGITPSADSSVAQRTDAVAAAIAGATPQQLMDMKKADEDFQVQMANLGFKDKESLASLVVQDTTDARQMQMNTKSWVPAVLTLVLTLGFFSTLYILAFVPIPKDSQAFVFGTAGTVATAWLIAVHFWFGDTNANQKANLSSSS